MKPKSKLRTIFVILILATVIGGVYLLHKIDKDFLSAAAILLSATIALSGALLSILIARQTARESNSLNFQKALQDEKSYHEHVRTAHEAIKNRRDFRKLSRPEYRFDQDSQAIHYVLNTWERAANAIRHGLYDEYFLYEAHKSMVIDFGMYFREFIDESQKRQPTFFENFSWLVLKWTIRRDSFKETKRRRDIKKIFKLLNKAAPNKQPEQSSYCENQRKAAVIYVRKVR